MQVKIISTGKLKEKSYQEISDEFSKRIRPFCSLKIIEVQAENLKTVSSEKIAREREAQRILPLFQTVLLSFHSKLKGKFSLPKILRKKLPKSQIPA